jgi:hypothetical protein
VTERVIIRIRFSSTYTARRYPSHLSSYSYWACHQALALVSFRFEQLDQFSDPRGWGAGYPLPSSFVLLSQPDASRRSS